MEIDGFRGEMVTLGHADYDSARAVWNGGVDKRPRLIARCSGTADVAVALRFARDRDLEIAVRGGGHNVAGTAVCDDGIVIDLAAMRSVWVDPAGRTAEVQGGALWGDVDHETQAHGLATTGGIVSHTGVAGLTLGGGIGWLMRKHGLTSWPPRSSQPTAASSGHRRMSTPICSGRCAAVAATSAWSRRSGSRCTPSARP
jgi:FAD/FMN-containing dehydrogenase